MLSLIALSFTTNAQAYIFWGNPELSVRIDRTEGDLIAGDADLKGIRVQNCTGGHTDYRANETIDPVDGWTVTITGGNLCSVKVLWDSDQEVWSNAFTLKSNSTSHTVDLTGTVSTKPWTPFTVASGTFSGSDPVVEITIQ